MWQAPMLVTNMKKLSADDIIVKNVKEPTGQRKPVYVSSVGKLSDHTGNCQWHVVNHTGEQYVHKQQIQAWNTQRSPRGREN